MKFKRTYFFEKTRLLVKSTAFALLAGAVFYLAFVNANQARAAAPLSGKNLTSAAFSSPASPAAPLACPAGTSTVTFDWSSSPGTGNEWLSSYAVDGETHTYSVPYTDIGGSPKTVDVTVTLRDPDGVNFDANFTCPPEVTDPGQLCDAVARTETNGAYGASYLTIAMASRTSADTVGFDFSFSESMFLDNFFVSDIDDVGYNFQPTVEPSDSFQDTVSVSASNGGTDVPLTLITGSNISTPSPQTAQAIVVAGVNGNLDPADAAGTVTVSSDNTAIDTFTLTYSNGPDDAANEPTTDGVSNGHAIRIPGFAFCVQDAAATLNIAKSVSPTAPVAPGETLTYSIVVSNTGSVNQTDIVINDLLLTGVTYLSGSTTATYLASSDSVGDDFSSGDYTGFTGSDLWTGPWVENDPTGVYVSVDGGRLHMSWTYVGDETIQRTADLSSFTTAELAFDWETTLGAGETMSLLISSDGGASWTTLATFGGTATGAFSQDISSYASATTAIRFENQSVNWDSDSDNFYFDNLTISSQAGLVTMDNSGGGNPQLVDGAPPNLVTAADGIDLQPGEAMTVTFQVTVDDPLDSGITEIVNSASATSNQQIETITDSAINLVSGVDYDFGDLPAAYDNTLLNPDNGARHVMGSLFLGAAVDDETDGQESSDASGDSNDDGLVRDAADFWQPGATVNIDVTTTGGAGRLAGWFDWNGDGDFDDAGEFVDFGSVSGSQSLSLTIPVSYTTSNPIAARFRLFDPAALPGGSLDSDDYAGIANNGEVEDYVWEYGPSPVMLQGVRVSTPSSLFVASVIVFMMLTLVSFSVYRFRIVAISRK